MNRRNLFKSLLGLAALPFLSKSTKAQNVVIGYNALKPDVVLPQFPAGDGIRMETFMSNGKEVTYQSFITYDGKWYPTCDALTFDNGAFVIDSNSVSYSYMGAKIVTGIQ